MRVLIALPLLLASAAAFAAPTPPAPAQLDRAFELAGVRLLCEQSGTLLQRGAPESYQKQLASAFAAEAVCADLAAAVAPRLEAAQLAEIEQALDSELARRFTAAEREVDDGLVDYRKQLADKPPRADRVELVHRLDRAARTTDLAALLRYEVGKTLALLSLRQRGERISEPALAQQTAQQAEGIHASSAQAVESFMLYAYRQMPSEQVQAYAELYERPAVKRLLDASLEALPGVFAKRRALLK
ncbi:hypothetical protein [Metapseudomonas otitidis]|uniref:DUF2059 domain-containing protein n=1 Tax=Metapseudomonas otitidis TaxID=319939 RepID=A0A6S5RG91_9GAMM|nr:hypothetical protein [Pseudomonas otitidis]BBT14092.1 hypothetical protein WP8S17C03_01410 [Pseudomonas otitidis]